MSKETVREERREQKIYQDMVNLCEEESTKDLYKEMDTLREDLESEQSEFFRNLEDIDNEPNDDAPANSDEPLMNTVPEERDNFGVAQESDIQANSDEKSEHCDGEQSDKGILAKYWLLFAGIGLAGIGMFGVIGLRLNIVQTYLLSIDNPFPGIGTAEPMGHIGSIIPFAIGIVAIFVWGFLSDKGEGSEEDCETAEKENTLEPTEPNEHVGAVISLGMGIIALIVWGWLPARAEIAKESECEDGSVKEPDTVSLKSKDSGKFRYERLSSHKYC